MEIYIVKNNLQMGPYDIGQVSQMLQTGILEKYDLYWHEGMLDWAPVGGLAKPDTTPNLPASYSYGSVIQQHYPAPGSPSPMIVNHQGQVIFPKSRVAYVLLGLFLGGLGVHNFYAGYTGKGVAQLLITLFGGILIFPILLVLIWVLIEICTVDKDASGVRFS